MAAARSLDSDGFAATVAMAGVVPAAVPAGGLGGPPPLGSVKRGASLDAGRRTAAEAADGEGSSPDVMGEGVE